MSHNKPPFVCSSRQLMSYRESKVMDQYKPKLQSLVKDDESYNKLLDVMREINLVLSLRDDAADPEPNNKNKIYDTQIDDVTRFSMMQTLENRRRDNLLSRKKILSRYVPNNSRKGKNNSIL